jgi:multimeric flavodoxin WrbA
MTNDNLRAIILLGTLKPSPQLSHTQTLCELLIEEFSKHSVQAQIVRLADYNIKPGILNDVGEGDEWPKILRQILDSNIVIFATPIWWGIQSSLIQRIIERMDELNENLLATGESELANKVGGIVITGAEDGAEHIIGNICNFMVWNGLTMPPACSLSYLGNIEETSHDALLEQFRKNRSLQSMSKIMAINLSYFARLLQANPIPVKKGKISQSFNE